MASRQCYNCGDSTHVSKFCTQPQRYSRCGRCQNVCLNQSAHKIWCTDPNFISVLLPVNQNQAAGGIAENFEVDSDIKVQCHLAFKNVRNVRVRNNGIESTIDNNMLLRDTNVNIVRLELDENADTSFSLGWKEGETKTINIAKKNVDNVLVNIVKLKIGPEGVRVNNFYGFESDGDVRFNLKSDENSSGHFDVQFVVSSVEKFNLRFQWQNMRYYFVLKEGSAHLQAWCLAPTDD